MKKTHFFILIMAMLVGAFVISCKVKNKKVATDTNIESIKEVSVKDLAMGDTKKINPDQAIINVLVTDIGVLDGTTTFQGKVINVEKKGFGFKASLNVEDLIKIITNKDISISTNKELRCIIEQITSTNQDAEEFRLIRLI